MAMIAKKPLDKLRGLSLTSACPRSTKCNSFLGGPIGGFGPRHLGEELYE